MAVNKAILEKWAVAQKRHRLSDKYVQMARELGLNPDKLGKIDNHRQETWKAPLPQFIEEIYYKRFKREAPVGEIKSVRQIAKEQKIKQEQKKKEKLKKRKEQERQKTIAVFDRNNLLEGIVSATDSALSPALPVEDMLSACANETDIDGRHFRIVSSSGKISVTDIGVCTLEDFDTRNK